MLTFKHGVSLGRLAAAGIVILAALKETSRRLGVPLVITETDQHHPPLDPHTLGEAFDVRSHDLDPDLRPKVVHLLHEILGDEFYATLEDVATSNEHFHIQRRRATVFAMEEWIGS